MSDEDMTEELLANISECNVDSESENSNVEISVKAEIYAVIDDSDQEDFVPDFLGEHDKLCWRESFTNNLTQNSVKGIMHMVTHFIHIFIELVLMTI
jgi:hypothetical protein